MGQFASFWYQGALTGFEYLCIKSFLDYGHEFFLYTYDDELLTPPGCVVRTAHEFFDEDAVFFYSKNAEKKVSAFSNMFRYRMIYETGLCWVDTDVLCLSENFPMPSYMFARQDSEFYNGAILRLPVGHEAMHLAAEYCWAVRESAVWGDLGPRLVTKIVDEYDLESQACPTEWFYPVHWRNALKLLDPASEKDLTKQIENAHLIHLWNEIFSRHGVNKKKLPPDGSFLANAVERHRVEEQFATC
jgi:hypothetical protein